jgi:glycosyltransferase involved in cell wall biosynthesis
MDSRPPGNLNRLPSVPQGQSGWPWTAQTAVPIDSATVEWPRITVVTPSYQQGGYVEECLRSVLLQNYPNLEYIVIDGGSTDGSADIIARYSPFLAYWHSQKDAGQGDAINQGFARSTGDLLGWINSDDLLLPGALFAVAREFLRGNPDLVYGDALNAFEDDRTIQYWQGYWLRRSFMKFGGLISSHAVFWRRSIHVPIWAQLNCAIDGELWQRLVPGRRVRYLPQPLGVCRVHGESKSNAERWKARWKQDEQMIWSRHGRPPQGRVFRQWFAKSQRVFKWVAWRRNRAAKRSVIAACQWSGRNWRGPKP